MSDIDSDSSLNDSISDGSSAESESDIENEVMDMEWVNCPARERPMQVCLHWQPNFGKFNIYFLVLIFFFYAHT
jgi:hypothetical protein